MNWFKKFFGKKAEHKNSGGKANRTPDPKGVEPTSTKEKKLRIGDIVDIDPLVLGKCVVERIQTNPDGKGDIAFVRAEKAVHPLEYESEPGDPTLYQFRSWFLEQHIKR